jgi:hypothetical protein
MAKVLGVVGPIAFFCLGAYFTWHAAVLGRLPMHFAWFSPIKAMIEVLAGCLIWAVIWRLIERSQPPRMFGFLTQGGPHYLSINIAGAELGVTTAALLALIANHANTLPYAAVGLGGFVGALGSIAIYAALFRGQAPPEHGV